MHHNAAGERNRRSPLRSVSLDAAGPLHVSDSLQVRLLCRETEKHQECENYDSRWQRTTFRRRTSLPMRTLNSAVLPRGLTCSRKSSLSERVALCNGGGLSYFVNGMSKSSTLGSHMSTGHDPNVPARGLNPVRRATSHAAARNSGVSPKSLGGRGVRIYGSGSTVNGFRSGYHSSNASDMLREVIGRRRRG